MCFAVKYTIYNVSGFVFLNTRYGALNITCLSYDGTLNFGYTGCRDTLPSMQSLAVLSGEALEELVTTK